MMTTETSKQDYLKRYLEDNKSSEKKRKKKPKSKTIMSRLKIVDQDIDLKTINFEERDEEVGDEAPVIAEIIDERPPEMRESCKSSLWKKINNDVYQSDSAHSRTSRNKDLNPSSLKHASDSKGSNLGSSCISENRQKSKRIRHDSDSDISPPRIQKESGNQMRHDSDSNVSLSKGPKQNSHRKKHSSGSDISPPRKMKHNDDDNRHCSDSDLSPPRHSEELCRYDRNSNSGRLFSGHTSYSSAKLRSNLSSGNKIKKNNRNSDSDISPPRSKSSVKASLRDESMKPRKTLSGLKAGLQDSETLRQETLELRKREKKQLNMLDDSVTGRNADTVIRDKQTGLRRDLDREKQIKDEEDEKSEKHQQKYMEWGKGIKQTQNKIDKFADDLYEMSKPLARYKDDDDLEERLKSVIHDDDPMSEYMKKKKRKNAPSIPVYSGPPAPPNRFGIFPGYRWDGVDRSNGFESRYFGKVNSAKAIQEESYLWSVQNM